MNRLRLLALCLSLALALPSCTKTCKEHIDCQDIETRPGLCLYHEGRGPYCAEPTPTCPSMFRWERFAEAEIAYKCVDPALIPKDAGADMVPPATDAAATTDGGSSP
jgi:hypothetical protein